MNGTCLNFESPIRDAVSRIRFAPQSNNLIISSWDSSLRLYDVDSLKLRLEVRTEAALLDCCFQNESIALTAGSDCSIRRYNLHSGTDDIIGNLDDLATCVEYSDETSMGISAKFLTFLQMNAELGSKNPTQKLANQPLGYHVLFKKGQVITAGWDKKIWRWDSRSMKALGCLNTSSLEVESMFLSGFILMVAVGASVNIYDLRNLNKSVHEKESHLNIRIKCVRPTLISEGFAVGSIDGRVQLKYFHSSGSDDEGYAFRCYPKAKDGRRHLAAVNDIAFNPSICGAFVTGDNDGYVTTWDARSKKRLLELPRYPNSIASLSYNNGGHLLAVASSYTYQEANESEKPPQIFIHDKDEVDIRSYSAGTSKS